MNINHHNISFYICLKVIHGSFFAVMYSKHSLLRSDIVIGIYLSTYIDLTFPEKKHGSGQRLIFILPYTFAHLSVIVQKTFLCDKKDFLSTWFLLMSIFDI